MVEVEVEVDGSDLRRRMAEQRAQIQRRIANARDRASTFNAALLSARSIADQTVSHRAQLNRLKAQLRKCEADLAQAQAIQTSKRSNSKLIAESISNTTATNEQLRSLVMEHEARRDDYTSFISNQLQAIESLEADSAAQGDKNLDEAIMWYNKFLGLQVVGGEGVKFIFNKIDLKSPDKEYMFCIKLTKEKYSLLQCVPFVEGSEELVNDLNCDNDLFKFVRIMRERFQAATILGVLPASSFCPDTTSITSSLSALSLDSRSTANQRRTRSGTGNQETPTKKGLSAQSAISPNSVMSSKRRSLQLLVLIHRLQMNAVDKSKPFCIETWICQKLLELNKLLSHFVRCLSEAIARSAAKFSDGSGVANYRLGLVSNGLYT